MCLQKNASVYSFRQIRLVPNVIIIWESRDKIKYTILAQSPKDKFHKNS